MGVGIPACVNVSVCSVWLIGNGDTGTDTDGDAGSIDILGAGGNGICVIDGNWDDAIFCNESACSIAPGAGENSGISGICCACWPGDCSLRGASSGRNRPLRPSSERVGGSGVSPPCIGSGDGAGDGNGVCRPADGCG